jgi:hypothetical protein
MSEELQEPISKEQYYRNNADALSDEHARALLAYREATRALRIDTLEIDGIDELNKHDQLLRSKRRDAAEAARIKLDEIEAKLAAKGDEARTEIGDPDIS